MVQNMLLKIILKQPHSIKTSNLNVSHLHILVSGEDPTPPQWNDLRHHHDWSSTTEKSNKVEVEEELITNIEL